jgi:Taurine catabolism dioxygenase TauD, TfdA family
MIMHCLRACRGSKAYHSERSIIFCRPTGNMDRVRVMACRSFSSVSAENNIDLDSLQSIPRHFLRDSDPSNFDATTQQRTEVTFDINSGKPIHHGSPKQKYVVQSVCMDGTDHLVEWGDGVTSRYSDIWIQRTLARWKNKPIVHESKVLWTGLSEDDVRKSDSMSISFEALLEEDGVLGALKSVFQYGILLVTGTPTGDAGAGVAALASALSGGSNKTLPSTSLLANYKLGRREVTLPNGTEGPLRTLYGSVWFTSSMAQVKGISTADSSYGQEGLPLHTDMTYHRDPPGLQIFTMVQPAFVGGESVFGDGFAAAKQLLKEDPEAFATLSSIIRTYRCGDLEMGWDLQAQGPVIQLNDGVIVCIRHNDLDRLPDLSPYASDEFYERLLHAHQKWDEILAQDEIRLIMKLQPGDTVVVANQVCFELPFLYSKSFFAAH